MSLPSDIPCIAAMFSSCRVWINVLEYVQRASRIVLSSVGAVYETFPSQSGAYSVADAFEVSATHLVRTTKSDECASGLNFDESDHPCGAIAKSLVQTRAVLTNAAAALCMQQMSVSSVNSCPARDNTITLTWSSSGAAVMELFDGPTLNALTPQLIDNLASSLRSAFASRSVRASVLQAAGPHFWI